MPPEVERIGPEQGIGSAIVGTPMDEDIEERTGTLERAVQDHGIGGDIGDDPIVDGHSSWPGGLKVRRGGGPIFADGVGPDCKEK